VAGWAEMAALARKCQQKFMAAAFTFDPCKAVMEDAAVQKTIDDLFDVWPEKPVPGCEPFIIDLLQRLKIVLNTLIVLRGLRFSGLINRGYIGQLTFSSGKITLK